MQNTKNSFFLAFYFHDSIKEIEAKIDKKFLANKKRFTRSPTWIAAFNSRLNTTKAIAFQVAVVVVEGFSRVISRINSGVFVVLAG